VRNKIVLISVAVMLVIGLVIGLVVGCAPTPAPAPAPTPTPKAEPVTLKLVSFLPKDQEFSFGIGWFAERVNQLSNGEITIDYLGGPEVIPPPEQPEAARTGVVDIVVTPSTIYEPLLPEGHIFHLTQIRPWEEREAKSGFYDAMVERHKTANLFYMGRAMAEWGFHTWTQFPVDNIREDLKGRKVALVSPSSKEFMRRLGFSVVIVSMMDLFTSVERGVVDACTYPVSGWFFGLHEITKYCIDIRFGTGENVLYIMNLDKWNSLSKQQQEVLMDAMKSIERDALPRDQGLYKEFRQKFVDGGTQFLKFSPEDTKWFLDLYFDSEWDETAKKIGQETADKLREMMAKK